LNELRDSTDHAAWQRFDETYRPLLVAYGVRLGLNGGDAEEAAQRTAIAVLESLRQNQYDARRGLFRHWLLGIARHKIAELCRELARHPMPASQRSSVDAALSALRDPDTVTSLWESQWEAHVVSVCLGRAWRELSEQDMRVFELLTAERRSPAEVAQETGLSRNAVYKTKYRVLRFMNAVRAELEMADRREVAADGGLPEPGSA